MLFVYASLFCFADWFVIVIWSFGSGLALIVVWFIFILFTISWLELLVYVFIVVFCVVFVCLLFYFCVLC